MYSDFSGNNRELLRLSAENDSLNYKDVSVLSNFISEQGKILPRRTTGLRAKQQKKTAKLWFWNFALWNFRI